MAQHNSGPQWGPQSVPVPPRRKMRTRPAFYAVVACTWLLTFGCTAAAIDSGNEQELKDAKASAKARVVPGPTVTVTVTATPTAKVSASAKPTIKPTAEPAPKPSADKPVTRAPAVRPTQDEEAFTDNSSGDNNKSAYYANCSAVRAAGAAPIRRGDAGYGRHLDRDGDGVACE